jgi:hypothetical protein
VTDDGLRALAAAMARIELQQAELLEAVKALQARQAPPTKADDLVEALADYFGRREFSARMVLMAADDPGSAIAAGLAGLRVNMDAPSSIAIGRALAALPGVQTLDTGRGTLKYCVKGYPR